LQTADWWSIGIIAYQLVTGELPFADREDLEK
jgi:serine/threonine protein kinase